MMYSSNRLRLVLGIDAAMCLAAGGLLAAAAGALAELLALPEVLLREAGLVLLPWGAFVAWVAGRHPPGRRVVLAVVVVNALWAVDSLVLLVSSWVAPNALGVAVVLVQAAATAGLAAVQALALPRPGGLQRA
jgi:hypothetical protein